MKVLLLLPDGTEVERDLTADAGTVCLTCGAVGEPLACGHPASESMDSAMVLARAWPAPDLRAAMR